MNILDIEEFLKNEDVAPPDLATFEPSIDEVVEKLKEKQPVVQDEFQTHQDGPGKAKARTVAAGLPGPNIRPTSHSKWTRR
jgi:hypothetical protein